MLEGLGVVSASWRHANSQELQRLVPPGEQLLPRLRWFAELHDIQEVVYLSTCNRVEVIFARSATTQLDLRSAIYELLTGTPPTTGQAERALRAWHGEAACEHLFLVACGLDSAVVGEVEVTGQLRTSLEFARRHGLSGPRMELVITEALRTAAAARQVARLGEGRVSQAEICVTHIRHHLQSYPGTVALVGVSPMTRRAAESLAEAQVPLLFTNRTSERGQELASRYDAPFVPLDRFLRRPPALSALLTATGSRGVLLDAAAIHRLARAAQGSLLLVDLAVPPDSDAGACREIAVRRIGMDQLLQEVERNRAARLQQAAAAREHVDEALLELRRQASDRSYGPLFGVLQQRYRRTANDGLQDLLKRELRGLSPPQIEALQRWTGTLARRFAHIPTRGIRGLLHRGPQGSLDAFLQGLEPEFAAELQSALTLPARDTRAIQP